MSGTISSLGLGSGTLTNSVISQLRAAEESARLTPIDTKLTKNKQQQSDLSTLMIGIASLKTNAADLADSTLYLKRSASSSSSAISMSVNSGVTVQNATMKVTKLALNDIYQSSGQSSADATIATATKSFTYKLGNGTATTISVPAGTTLSGLADLINSSAGSAATASVINTGSATNPYRLIIKANNTGADNRITITENMSLGLSTSKYDAPNAAATGSTTTTASGDLTINGVAIDAVTTSSSASAESNALLFVKAINAKTSSTNVYAVTNGSGKISLASTDGSAVTMSITAAAATASGLATGALSGSTVLAANTTYAANKLQSAQNATFTFNGIAMERAKNSITDLITGATFTLNDTMTSNATIAITQDTSGISDAMSQFVTNYNALVTKLSDLTKYDTTTKTSATFTGQNAITSILSQINNAIFGQDANGHSLTDLGITMSENGTISLNSSTLASKLSSDAAGVESILRGATTTVAAAYTAKATASASTGSLALGDIKINGISIGAVDLTATTSQENAQLIMNAINLLSSQTGVKAKTDGAGKLILNNASGGTITLTTTANGASLSGLTTSAVTSSQVAAGSVTTRSGFMASLNTLLAGMSNGSTGSLDYFQQSLVSDSTSETDLRAQTVAQLDAKYNQMATQFAAYDKMIANYNQMGTTLTNMISAMNKTTSN